MNDIYGCVFKLLQFKDIYSCMLTNKHFYGLINQELFWHHKYALNYHDCDRIGNYYESCKIYHNISKLFQKLTSTRYYANINYFYKLQNLNIGDEKLIGVPNEIYVLTNLTNLQLSYNDIGYIPTELCLMTNLRSLYLSNANIKSIPNDITNMYNLNTLVLCNTYSYKLDITTTPNSISTIPAEMFKMTNLRCLNLYHNPIKGSYFSTTNTLLQILTSQ